MTDRLDRHLTRLARKSPDYADAVVTRENGTGPYYLGVVGRPLVELGDTFADAKAALLTLTRRTA